MVSSRCGLEQEHMMSRLGVQILLWHETSFCSDDVTVMEKYTTQLEVPLQTVQLISDILHSTKVKEVSWRGWLLKNHSSKTVFLYSSYPCIFDTRWKGYGSFVATVQIKVRISIVFFAATLVPADTDWSRRCSARLRLLWYFTNTEWTTVCTFSRLQFSHDFSILAIGNLHCYDVTCGKETVFADGRFVMLMKFWYDPVCLLCLFSSDTYSQGVNKFLEMLPRLISQPYDGDLRLREHTLMVAFSIVLAIIISEASLSFQKKKCKTCKESTLFSVSGLSLWDAGESRFKFSRSSFWQHFWLPDSAGGPDSQLQPWRKRDEYAWRFVTKQRLIAVKHNKREFGFPVNFPCDCFFLWQKWRMVTQRWLSRDWRTWRVLMWLQ